MAATLLHKLHSHHYNLHIQVKFLNTNSEMNKKKSKKKETSAFNFLSLPRKYNKYKENMARRLLNRKP